MEMQLIQERIANAAMELFATTCVLSRWDSELSGGRPQRQRRADHFAADLFVRRAFRKTRDFLRGLGDNDDRAMLQTADAVLGKKMRRRKQWSRKRERSRRIRFRFPTRGIDRCSGRRACAVSVQSGAILAEYQRMRSSAMRSPFA